MYIIADIKAKEPIYNRRVYRLFRFDICDNVHYLSQIVYIIADIKAKEPTYNRRALHKNIPVCFRWCCHARYQSKRAYIYSEKSPIYTMERVLHKKYLFVFHGAAAPDVKAEPISTLRDIGYRLF